jgi:hypothetical protein
MKPANPALFACGAFVELAAIKAAVDAGEK